jgi:acetyl esterase/lipase
MYLKPRIISLFVCLLLLTSTTTCALPRDTTYTPYLAWLNIKKNYSQVKIAERIKDASLLESTNLVYATVTDSMNQKRDLHLDIFRPAKKGKYPALLMIHGGGWRSGNKTMEAPMAQRVALQGYVTIPVEYRLSTEAKFPIALFDIKAAIRWVKVNADKYGIDSSRIAIEGNSAGGQLAALAGMTNNVSKFEGTIGTTTKSSIHAVIDIDGVVDFMAPGSLNLVRKPNSPDVEWLGGTFYDKPEIWKDASPVFWVNEKSVPVLFVCSTQPRFHAGRDEMIDMLNQYKIYSEVHTIPDTPHTFWLFDPWFTPTVDYMVAFLDKVFKSTNK